MNEGDKDREVKFRFINGGIMFSIEEELKKLPDKPGVYLMHDKHDTIIYVGKAISLKNRVRQYFQASRQVTPKIARMIEQISYFEYIVTDSELEALVLECNLIKENSPRYNTMLKDGKSYPFLKATIQEEYPRFVFSRQMKRDGSKYFGPFVSGKAIRDTIEVLNKVYHLRNCSRVLPRDMGKDRPCLYHQMNQCKAPCQGYISKEEYQESFSRAMDFLDGNPKSVIQDMEKKMYDASAEMDFEQAAVYRDYMQSLIKISERQKITSEEVMDRDLIALAKNRDDAVVQVFFVRDGKIIGREHFFLTGVEGEEKGAILGAFIKQMYAGTPYIPKELFLETEPEDQEVIENWLSEKRGSKVYVRVPKRGNKEHLMEMAYRNASMILNQDIEKLKREEARTVGAMKEISDILGIPASRVESYDISNINGFQTVGSMVVFERGKAKKNDYRKFRIQTVTGPDDYKAMEEMLTRRFTHAKRHDSDEMDAFSIFPDVILMDGGKGQVHICERVLENLGISIPVCGMVKDDHHRTRGLYFNDEELPIDTHSEGFHLITRIQDETHRFAIEYHRSLRRKGQTHSILDDIKGIGPQRRRALMKHYESLEAIQYASVEELAAIPEMNEKAARAVVDFFKSKSEEE